MRRHPLPDPFTPEPIIVQSHGMQRWLAVQISRKNGILANTRFLFPNEFLNLIHSIALDDFDSERGVDKNSLLWKIYQLLQTDREHPKFRRLQHYLQDGNPLKVFQLAKRLAHLFDQYDMYRPDWISAWEKEESGHWQQALWKKMQKSPGMFCSRTSLHKALMKASGKLPGSRFPKRISLFGLSNLPLPHIETLQKIAGFSDIDCYFLNPSPEFWTDIQPKRKIAGIGRKEPDREHYLEEGNSLLASWGTTGKEFYHMLLDRGLTDDYGQETFSPVVAPQTLLEHIKSDIFHLKNPTEKTVIDPQDRSITVHSCHGRLREMEVLHDQILDLLERDPQSTPDDIVVMSPNIEEYASAITAVFSSGSAAGQTIPYSIADRSVKKRGLIIPFFFRLLDVVASRFAVSDVFDILESELIREKFDISAYDLDKIKAWIDAVNVRWGIDRDFRSQEGKTGVYHTTWDFGIDRILTGIALPLEERELLELPGRESILPYDHVEGLDTQCFGKFLDFFYKLVDLKRHKQDRLNQSRTLREWSIRLQQLVQDFFPSPDRQAQEYRLLADQFHRLEETQNRHEIHCKIEYEIMVLHLKSKLEDQKSSLGFLGSGLTFCSMLPMRSIPFSAIFMVGMNDGAFPRATHPVSFDLMAKERRMGDRSIKDEDKYMFLEAILSARKTLSISYVGQSGKDNATLPPSNLLNELLHYIDGGYRLEKGKLIDRLVTRHPLQAFSPKYFDGTDERLFSYSKENCRAAKSVGAIGDRQPFLTHCPNFTTEIADAGLLVRFFANPCEYLLTEGLGLTLERKRESPRDQELFSLDSLSSYLIQSELLRNRYRSAASSDIKEIYRAKDRLPLRNIGDLQYRELEKETHVLFELIDPYVLRKSQETLHYDFRCNGLRLTGRLDNIWDGTLVHFSPVRCKAKLRLQLWIEQLVYHCATGRPIPGILISKSADYGKKKRRYVRYSCTTIETPEAHLAMLVDYFFRGHGEPLAFFPESALQYVVTRGAKTEEAAETKAKQEWEGVGDFKEGERKDPYIHCCFQHTTLCETDFRQIGSDILEPLLEAQHLDGG